ncbi:MAG: site-specific integrase, partial [Spirochaetaceae bacterium]|nr:site-specific integrase [Spirochaetaceae bacterium]
MPRLPKPYILLRRKDAKTFQIILNTTSGLSAEVCRKWQRVSFQNFPDALAQYRDPKTKRAAEIGAVALIQYLKNQPEPNFIVSARSQPATDILLVQYAAHFWTPNSSYVREKTLVKGKPLSAVYIKTNREHITRHIEPFPPFRDIPISNLTPGLIRDWMVWMTERGASGRLINAVLQALRVAVKDLSDRGDLDFDPFRRIKPAQESPKEKGILVADEVSRLIRAPIQSPARRLAVLLGALCGMRRGEGRGLQWDEIRDGYINICQNWQDMEGVKNPKWGSSRTVPIPSSVSAALAEVRKGSAGTGFVLESPKKAGVPVSTNFFRYALREELAAIGISAEEQKRRNITFHSLRHTFITLGRLAGISDLEIQALAGHKSAEMMAHYSHAGQVLDFTAAREKL